MRHRRIHEAGVEHAGQLHVDGIAGATRHLGLTIPALGRLADVVKSLLTGKTGGSEVGTVRCSSCRV